MKNKMLLTILTFTTILSLAACNKTTPVEPTTVAPTKETESVEPTSEEPATFVTSAPIETEPVVKRAVTEVKPIGPVMTAELFGEGFLDSKVALDPQKAEEFQTILDLIPDFHTFFQAQAGVTDVEVEAIKKAAEKFATDKYNAKEKIEVVYSEAFAEMFRVDNAVSAEKSLVGVYTLINDSDDGVYTYPQVDYVIVTKTAEGYTVEKATAEQGSTLDHTPKSVYYFDCTHRALFWEAEQASDNTVSVKIYSRGLDEGNYYTSKDVNGIFINGEKTMVWKELQMGAYGYTNTTLGEIMK